MVDMLDYVLRYQTVEVTVVSGNFGEDAPIAVKSMLLDVADPAVMEAVIDVKHLVVDEEVAAMAVQTLEEVLSHHDV